MSEELVGEVQHESLDAASQDIGDLVVLAWMQMKASFDVKSKFTGKQAINFFISNHFCSSRTLGVQLGSAMLQQVVG